MARVLVRNLDDFTVARLREDAENKGMRLEEYLRDILTSHARSSLRAIREQLLAVQQSWGDRIFSDSADAIHEDRYE